jgi:MarR family transcriptional regulator, organic hydroperoxide resistance regulator
MRELFRALSELESRLMQSHGVSLNEAMVLCAIGKERVAASTIV